MIDTEEFKFVDQQVLQLTATHKLLTELYGNRNTVQQMNTVSSLGFSLIQRAIQMELVIRICALTEGAGSGKRQTLTVLSLLDEVSLRVSDADDQLDGLRSKLQDVVKSLKVYRNKIVAHLDKSVALGQMTIDPVKTDDLDATFVILYEVMNKIRQVYRAGDCIYDWTSIGTAASAIAWALADSLRSKELRDKANSGLISPEVSLELLKHRSGRNDTQIISRHSGTGVEADK